MSRLRAPLALSIALTILGSSAVYAGTVENTDENPNLHCSPTKWYNIVFFFITNYAIHAATVISLPGESGYTSAAYKACCLLVPFAGIRRGLNIFLRASALADTSLHGAARANALCMVVRSKQWRPRSGDVIEGCNYAVTEPAVVEETSQSEIIDDIEKKPATTTKSLDSKRLDVVWDVKAPYEHGAPSAWIGKVADFMLRSFRFRAMPLEHQVVQREDIEVHGVCELPPGYVLCFIPPHMDVRPRGGATHKVKLSSRFNALQILWSLAQTLIGTLTLWRTRGSQLNKYGFAAFGLTVIPYVIASIINLLGSLVSREYDDVYLVHSEIMDEALERGGVVDGVVGTICAPPEYDEEEEEMVRDEEHGRLGEAAFTFSDGVDGDGSLGCWRVDTPMASEVDLILAPPKTVQPRAEQTGGKWRSCWLKIKDVYVKPTNQPKSPKNSTKPQHTISVPCHGRFRRLPPAYFEPTFKVLAVALLITSVAAPYVIIYLLTGFQIRQATTTQAQFTLQWLCLGQLYGLIIAEFERHTRRSAWVTILFVVLVFYGWSAIAGSVMVIEEMIEFGTCSTW